MNTDTSHAREIGFVLYLNALYRDLQGLDCNRVSTLLLLSLELSTHSYTTLHHYEFLKTKIINKRGCPRAFPPSTYSH